MGWLLCDPGHCRFRTDFADARGCSLWSSQDAGGGFLNVVSANTGKQFRLSFDAAAYTDFRIVDTTGEMKISPTADSGDGFLNVVSTNTGKQFKTKMIDSQLHI